MARIFMGGVVVLIGLFVLALALGWVPVAPDSLHAPRWMIGAVGAFFLWIGLVFITTSPETGESPHPLVMAIGVTLFAAAFDWMAFGPSGGECVGPTIQFGTISLTHEESCRLAFGTMAVLLDVAAAGLWIQGLWRLVRGG